MDLFTIAGACFRRWYFTVPALLLVALLSFRAYAAVEPLYSSSRSVVVLPSLEEQAASAATDEEASSDDDDNPYSGQGGSRFAVAVLKRNINSRAFEERLGLDKGAEQTFEAESSDDQPMIHITATAPSEQGVHDLLDSVVSESAVVLNDFQADAGAPEVSRYRIAPAVPAGPVEDATPSRLRAAGAIAVLGGGLVAALVVGLDALLTRRRRRQDDVGPPAHGRTVEGSGPAREGAGPTDDTDHAAGARDDAPARSEAPADEDRVSATIRE